MARVWVGWLGSKKLSDAHSEWLSFSQAYGFQVVNSIKDAEIILLKNLSPRDVLKLLLSKRWRDLPRIQVLSEPLVVWPLAQSWIAKALFTRSIKLGRPTSEEGWEYHPQVYPKSLNSNFSGTTRLHSAVMVASNKFSFIHGENYSLRRICASGLADLDVFGREWKMGALRKLMRLSFELVVAIMSGLKWSFRQEGLFSSPARSMGAVQDKLGTMAMYKVALVIENSDEFISEKLFDAFLAGCIPVFVGPKLEQWGIPEQLAYIAEPNITSINDQIQLALKADFEEYQETLFDWLTQPETLKKWESSNVWRRVFSLSEAI
jgi:hypothetical protein